MAPAASSRQARLNFRLGQEQKTLIEQAARTIGQNVSDFAIGSMVRAAQETIQQATVTRLSNRDRELFLSMLDSDADPNEALQRAASRYRGRRA